MISQLGKRDVNTHTHTLPSHWFLPLHNLGGDGDGDGDGEVAWNETGKSMVRKDWKDRGERMGSAPQQFLGRVWNPHGEKVQRCKFMGLRGTS